MKASKIDAPSIQMNATFNYNPDSSFKHNNRNRNEILKRTRFCR